MSLLPTAIEVFARDGRKISVNLTTGMHNTVFFFGEYEKILTETITPLIREGDVCLDVGANFGWYTTFFHRRCGASGAVHAFEPIPATFKELELNYRLAGEPENIFINNLALGDRQGEIIVNLFAGMPTGHASLSRHGRDDFIPHSCRMTTLDSYLDRHNIKQVNFVKVDIEGAEMMFLKGAEKLFRQPVPPILVMEMALEQTSNFGGMPDDLIKFINERAAYDFYAVDEVKGGMKKIEGFAADDIGANVICIPRGFYSERMIPDRSRR